MRIINLRMYQVRGLKELSIESGVLNTEALMLVLKRRYSRTSNGGKMVFKYLDAQEDLKAMGRKKYTVNMLNGSDAYRSIQELIIPDTEVCVDSCFAGFAMPLIENHKNLGAIINDYDIPLSIKIPYLIQLGKIVDRVERINDESFRMQFGDLNEFNFIVDEKNKVYAVDLDSAYLGQDEPSNMAYYLLKNKYLYDLKDKYKTTNSGIIIPSDNSDLYCLNMIVLNTLAKRDIFKENMDIYYLYIKHLEDIGISTDLTNIFRNIYLPVDNSNSTHLLKDLDPNIEEYADFKTFQKEYKIK